MTYSLTGILAVIVPYAPLLAIGPVVIGWITIYVTRAARRRDQLIARWNEFSQSEHAGKIAGLVEANERDLVFDALTRIGALTVLSALEHLGRQTSARRADWEMVLPLDVHAEIKTLISRCGPLIALVRKTSVPLDFRCYNGCRKLAFANIMRAFC